MDKNSRTGKALKNTFVTIACQILYLMISLICRTVFTKILGAEYLGISGLFTNILTILSFAELGMGTALVYRLYAPLAENDYEKVKQYMRLYRQVYTIIIIVIAVCGIALIPFLEYLVDAPNVKEDLVVLYCLYLTNSLASYVFVHKKSLLIADQNDYIVSLFTQAFNIVMNIAQCILLVTTHDFILYCIVSIICEILNNIVCSIYTSKRYVFLNEPVYGKLSKKEVSELVVDVKGLLLTKVASTAFSGTDNLFISAFIGIQYVGILSNYTLLLNTVNTIMNKIFGSITATIGNLIVSKDKKQTEAVLKRMFFFNTSIYGYLCLGMIFLIREFVTEIWLSSEYTLSNFLIILTITELFFRSIHYPLYTTRNAMGYFSQYKSIFVGAAVLNIVLDFVLVRPLGIAGLYIATILCRGITYVVDILVVYHIGFEKSAKEYLGIILQWLLFLGICGLCCSIILRYIYLEGILGFVIRILIISFVYAVLFCIAYYRNDEYQYYVVLIKKIVRKRGRLI